MSKPGSIIQLVKKDVLLEVRQQYTFYGIVLYVASTIYVIYLSMGSPDDQVWNGLFWITQLFICVNAVAKSFLAENRGRMLYFYSIAGARHFIFAKLLFNAIITLAMTFISLLLFLILLGNPLEHFVQFVLVSMLGGVGLSLVFTFLAAIAAKAQQQAALITILGFPVIVPQILLLIKLSQSAFAQVVQAGYDTMVLLLLGLDVMIVVLALILFPFLWKD